LYWLGKDSHRFKIEKHRFTYRMWSAATENLRDRERMGKAIFKALLKKYVILNQITKNELLRIAFLKHFNLKTPKKKKKGRRSFQIVDKKEFYFYFWENFINPLEV
jgi:hypothetical protein